MISLIGAVLAVLVCCIFIWAIAADKSAEECREVYCKQCGEDRPNIKFCPKCGVVVALKPECDCGLHYNPIQCGGDYCVRCGKQLRTNVSERASDK